MQYVQDFLNKALELFFFSFTYFIHVELLKSVKIVLICCSAGGVSQVHAKSYCRFQIPWRPEVFNSPRQILSLLNKVPGYWLQGETDLANKPRILQIFPHSKFGINRTAGSKVMAKKFRPSNFLAITFEPVVRLIPNLKCRIICMFLGMFAKSVSPWSQ